MLVPTGKMPIAERFTWIQAAAGARESNAAEFLEIAESDRDVPRVQLT
jgi:hypothetical protein